MFDCCKKYDKLPRLHDILTRLIDKGDTELLQKGWWPQYGLLIAFIFVGVDVQKWNEERQKAVN